MPAEAAREKFSNEPFSDDREEMSKIEEAHGREKNESRLLNATTELEKFALAIKDADPRRKRALELAEIIRNELLI